MKFGVCTGAKSSYSVMNVSMDFPVYLVMVIVKNSFPYRQTADCW